MYAGEAHLYGKSAGASLGVDVEESDARIIYVKPGGPTTIIIDNDEEGTSSTGEWELRELDRYYGGTLRVSPQGAGQGDSYTFETSISGRVNVALMWYRNSTWGSDKVDVEVYDSNGLLETIPVSHRHNGSIWNDMGTYDFTGQAKVVVTKGDIMWASVDAVKFTYSEEPGSSWLVPFDNLSDALAVAVDGDEVWVAAATYVPGTTSEATFELDPGVKVYGGFAGDETERSQRDWVANETILSGDGVCSHVLMLGDGSEINGFTVTGGHTSDSGAGAYVDDASATVADCTFRANSAGINGGAIFADGWAAVTISDCEFVENEAQFGGAISFGLCLGATIENCAFTDNSASLDGGAVYQGVAAELRIAGCLLAGSVCGRDGGAIWLDNFSPEISGCIIRDNFASRGGAIFCFEGVAPTIKDCVIVDNCGFGGAIYSVLSELDISNCIIAYNLAPFSGSTGGDGGGIALELSDASINNCTVSYNSATGIGGAVSCRSDCLVGISNSILWGNTASKGPQLGLEESLGYHPTVWVTYSDVEGGLRKVWGANGVSWGPGNIEADPKFAPVTGAVSHWKFDEGKGAIAYDYVGANDGTIYGAEYTDGCLGYALDFNGVGDYVEVADDDSMNITDELALAAWIKVRADGIGNGIIVFKGTGSQPAPGGNDGSYGLVYLVGQDRLSISLNVNGWADHLSACTISIDTWYHVVGTYDGAEWRLYVDGSLDNSGSLPGSISTQSGSLFIGYENSWQQECFNGVIDDVRIYNRALSPEEIRHLYRTASIINDYHLQSAAGRWDPNANQWVTDAETSACIDAGNPGCPLGSEPNDANNIRINMGAYGGTDNASKSPADWRSIADLTNDWLVDFADCAVFADYWLEAGECIPSDLDRSKFVDFSDFAILAEDWLL
jgi:predicted outer membrane repeat protein